MARPRAKIDKKQFETLCAIQCTEEEICAVIGVDDNTLARWIKENYNGRRFSEVFKEKRANGKASLRRNQWRLSETNAAMSIWLGKQYLGQRDTPEPVGDANELLTVLAGALKDRQPKDADLID